MNSQSVPDIRINHRQYVSLKSELSHGRGISNKKLKSILGILAYPGDTRRKQHVALLSPVLSYPATILLGKVKT